MQEGAPKKKAADGLPHSTDSHYFPSHTVTQGGSLVKRNLAFVLLDIEMSGSISRRNVRFWGPTEVEGRRSGAVWREWGAGVLEFSAMRKIGIYVQVPFCQTRCTYCNFHTRVVSAERFAPYVEAVCREIRGHRELYEAAGVRLPEGFAGAVVEDGGESAWLKAERVAGLLGAGEAPTGSGQVSPSPTAGRWAGLVGIESEQTGAGQANPTPAVGGRGCLVDTVYFGGGTPSLLDPGHLKGMLDAIHGTFGGDWGGLRVEEVTLEADPETVTEEKAAAWVSAGINRVSFGVQSFVDKELAAAGRMHRRADIYRAVPILRVAGIGNISFDLIAGLAHQTKESWGESLRELARLEPEHVSIYLLEVDEGSRLGREVLAGGSRYSARAIPADDAMAEFYETACACLLGMGYHHYEISNWGKPGLESKHNLKYWRREAYLGFGAGAHSFSGTERWANAHDANEYVKAMGGGEIQGAEAGAQPRVAVLRLPIEQHEVLTAERALEEELFLGLRQLDGIDVGKIEQAYGVTLASRFDPLALAGLVEREGNLVRLAPEKLSVSNEVFVELMR